MALFLFKFKPLKRHILEYLPSFEDACGHRKLKRFGMGQFGDGRFGDKSVRNHGTFDGSAFCALIQEIAMKQILLEISWFRI